MARLWRGGYRRKKPRAGAHLEMPAARLAEPSSVSLGSLGKVGPVNKGRLGSLG